VPVPAAVAWAARAAGLVLFFVVVAMRGGPLSAQNDALAVTLPTTAVSHGQWRLAEQKTVVPDPPGYPLLAAPLVVVFRPLVGSPTWCSSQPVPAVLQHGAQASFYRSLLHLCSSQLPGSRRALPPWYRSQGVLGVLAWLVLLAGVQLLLRAVHRRPTMAEVVKIAGGALAVVVAGIAPFWSSDQAATWHALSGTYVQGAGVIRSGTAVGLLGISEAMKLDIARDAPVLLSALVCVAVWWKARDRLSAPTAVVGLALACLATRLVLEVSIFEYYFLAAGVFLFVLDLAIGRLPVWSVTWVLCTRYGVVGLASVAGPGWTAAAFMASSLAAFALGMSALSSSTRQPAIGPQAEATRGTTSAMNLRSVSSDG